MKYDRNGEQLKFYEDRAGKWRWRLTHNNGEIIGASSQGYVSKKSCIANAQRVVILGREIN